MKMVDVIANETRDRVLEWAPQVPSPTEYLVISMQVAIKHGYLIVRSSRNMDGEQVLQIQKIQEV